MTTNEHISRVRAKCVELLEIASKRTPGEWGVRKEYFDKGEPASCAAYNVFPHRNGLKKPADIGQWATLANCEDYEGKNRNNAHFIASCAGPAEAGWRATIAAIDHLLESKKARTLLYHEEQLAKSILSAWPEELL